MAFLNLKWQTANILTENGFFSQQRILKKKKKQITLIKKSKVEWHWYKFFILSLHLQFIDFIHLRHCFYRFISICFHFQKQNSKDTGMALFFFRFWNNPMYIFLNARHDNLAWTKPSSCVVKIYNHLFDTKFDVSLSFLYSRG